MRGFFRSPRFRVLLIVLIVLVLIGIVLGIMGSMAPPQEAVAGAAVNPVQRFFNAIGSQISGVTGVFGERDRLQSENATLREELSKRLETITDYEQVKAENEEFRAFYDVKAQNQDFALCFASRVAEDPGDIYHSFTIDKGLLDDIAYHDVVICDEGLIGYIVEGAPTYAKVRTILHPDLSFGGINSRTRDVGTLHGTLKEAEAQRLAFDNLKRDAGVTIGDVVLTHGRGGVFPRGLRVGRIHDIAQAASDVSLSVSVAPYVDFTRISQVAVITSFAGQGEIVD